MADEAVLNNLHKKIQNHTPFEMQRFSYKGQAAFRLLLSALCPSDLPHYFLAKWTNRTPDSQLILREMGGPQYGPKRIGRMGRTRANGANACQGIGGAENESTTV